MIPADKQVHRVWECQDLNIGEMIVVHDYDSERRLEEIFYLIFSDTFRLVYTTYVIVLLATFSPFISIIGCTLSTPKKYNTPNTMADIIIPHAIIATAPTMFQPRDCNE